MKLKFLHLALAAALAIGAAAPVLAQKKGGDVVVAITNAPPSLDPHSTSAQAARHVNLHMFESLYARDEGAKPVPDLAKSVAVSPDGLSYVFTLRSGVKFHNGKTMGPADVVASIERYRKGGASASLIAAIDSVSATGADQVTIKLKTVQSTFLGNLSSPRAPIAIMPAEEAAKEMGKADPIGTGPYRFVEYKPDSHVKLARFDGYVPNPAYKERDGFAGAKIAYLDTVTFRFIPEAGARDAATMTGQVHLNETSDESTAKRLKGNPGFTVMKALPYAVQVLKFNMAQGPGTDLNFRRAIAQAINAEEMLGTAYPDLYLMDQSWVYPGSPYHTGRALLKQDVAAAKANLAKSSYKGEKLIFIIDNIRPNVDAATVFQQQVAAIGVNIELKVGDWPTISGIGLKSDQGWNFWTHGFGIEPYEGPASAMSHWVKGQGQRKADPVIDDLFTKLNAEMDVAKQKQLFADFENRMADQAIAINLGDYGLFQVVSNKLKNFKPYRITRMWGVWLE